MRAESSQKKPGATKVAKSKLYESLVNSAAASGRKKLKRFGIRGAFHVGRNGFKIRCHPNFSLFVLHKIMLLLPVDFEMNISNRTPESPAFVSKTGYAIYPIVRKNAVPFRLEQHRELRKTLCAQCPLGVIGLYHRSFFELLSKAWVTISA